MHGTEPAIDWSGLTLSQTVQQPKVYDASFLRTTKRLPCPLLGCPGYSHTSYGMYTGFNRNHWEDMIRTLKEHPNPLPRCKRCGIQVSAGNLNNRHYALKKCKQGEERCIRRETLQCFFEASSVSLYINEETLPPLEAFPYLGRIIAYNNSDWAAVYLNLRKSQRRWGMIERVL